MAVIVYDHPLSPYAQKVKIALIEKNVPFEVPMPENIGAGGTAGEFADANPRGEVPALIDDGFGVFDSTIILEYIEDKWPTPPLLPAAPDARAKVRMIEEVMDTHFEAITWGLSEIANFGRAPGALGEEMTRRGGEQIARWYAWLEAQLGQADWFNGAAFGWGDLAVIPYVNGAIGFGCAPAAGSRLAAWTERCNARPSVAEVAGAARAMAMGGSDESAATLAAVREMIESGAFRREYRDHRLEWMVKTGGISVVSDGLAKNNIRFTDEFAP